MMKNLFQTAFFVLILSAPVLADSPNQLITMSQTNLKKLESVYPLSGQILATEDDQVLLSIPENMKPLLSRELHRLTGHCGGYMVLDADDRFEQTAANKSDFRYYDPKFDMFILAQTANVDPSRIFETIRTLSDFENRHYKTQEGIQSQKYIQTTWENLTRSIENANVELISHKKFPQPSVVLTIPGSLSNEEVIIGGHGDSVNWKDDPKNGIGIAPGADDNASGIAVITEVIRLIAESGFKPERTLTFIAYAGEEEGLLGSHDIAKNYQRQGKEVAAVMQLDMVNYKGKTVDLALIKDHVDKDLNQFLVQLLKLYLPDIKYGFDKDCGQCSDHASWYKYGYSASFPFESMLDEESPYIHTRKDVLEKSGNNADHAKIFAQLGLAFALELGRIK